MRKALTIALPHDGGPQKVLAGVDVPIDEHFARIKREFAGVREHPEFREVQLWISDAGISKHVKFKVPAPAEETPEGGEQSPAEVPAKRSKKK